MKKFLLEIAQDKRKDVFSFLLVPLLYLLSLVYGIIVRLVCVSYRRGILPGYKSKIKVISVGNITLGGTGKTPFVKYLAQSLSEEGKKVVILSRGYSMDEPRLLEANLPGIKVITGRDRIQKVKEIERDYPCDVIILDDGFQHWRLKRDLDIVLLNSREYLGNRNLIPRGILREPASSLRRAGIIVLSKADLADGFGYGCGYWKPHHRPLAYRKPNHGLVANNLGLIKEELQRINPAALVLESRHQPWGIYSGGKNLELSALGAKESIERTENRQEVIAESDFLAGKKVCLLSGIADPESFAQTVIKLGADIALDLRYPDHYSYKDEDISDIVNKCRDRKLDAIVTTEKDLPRLPLAIREAGLTVLVLKIELKIIENEKVFFERIHRILAG